VGHLLPNHEVKIAQDGEILIKGPLVMRGYYQDPGRTAATLDKDGFLHTGDKGFVDDEGFLTIVGRLKELYKSSTGEYIAPVPIEQAICRHPLIDMALVVADGKKFASCLLFPNPEALDRMKKRQSADPLYTTGDFLDSSFVKSEMKDLLEEVNRHLNRPEQIRSYRFVVDPLTVKGGELTPSMKIRREIVTKKFAQLIDTMYQTEGES
jgi:long-chain acyl-CoA synthetase